MEGTYEYELERAELLGVEPISREAWEQQNKARLEAQQEQEQSELAQAVEGEDEKIKGTHGKMDELNNVLSATQMKINKFKTVCGSFTSLLKIRSGSPAPSEDRGSTSNGQAPTSNINDAIETLDQMKEVEGQSDIQFAKKQSQDINQKVSKNLDALDRLISKAENAELSLQHQNKQMKGFLNK
ncbi:CLUMA_CG000451, isoform A [Clunio marinus]|uniref:CLUMA_CG000451, isoform A n=1 Tax=Clunio marinus TaxID=568069 RepID=A0A1J1HJG5_9DIPT|nr:CLUMA_CG000451, isoform A [Clunio marinus]